MGVQGFTSGIAPAHDDGAYDVVVVGGGPAGATAAHELALAGRSVMLLERGGRIKPCGGAIPPALIRQFDIPAHLLVARITCAQMVSPAERRVDMPIEGGFVGMVDREVFDEWLRERAASAGAVRRQATVERLDRDEDGGSVVSFSERIEGVRRTGRVRARCVVAADGARSQIARQAGIRGADRVRCVFAYHEIVRSPAAAERRFDPARCDVYYQGGISPDFYGWVFPHGATTSIGTGTAVKGYGLRPAVARLRQSIGLAGNETVRREGAPIPMRPLRRWDDGRSVLVAGDAAGVVAPASGEGIYYAMLSARLAGEAADAFLATGNVGALKAARKRFMREHGRVFWILGILQAVWYRSDRQRERFVSICRDKEVQRLTWEAYMNKKLVRRRPAAHLKVFVKDLAHLLGMADRSMRRSR